MAEKKKFIDHNFTYAVVGVSRNPEKYGHRVYQDLRNAGFTVFPINPNAREIDDQKCYPDLKTLPHKPHNVVVVVPPNLGLKTIKEGFKLGIKKYWFQPGAESEKIREFAEHNNLEIMADGSCIMIERKKY